MYLLHKFSISRTYLFILLSITLSAEAEPSHLDIKVPDLLREEATGPIKSIETDICKNTSGKHTRTRKEYDTAGNLIVTLKWDHDDELINITSNLYDEAGCWITQKYKSFGKKGITNAWEVILNPDTRQIAMQSERTGSIAIRTYSPEKHLNDYRLVDKEKKLKVASHEKWNSKNRRTQYIRYDKDNKPLYTYWFKWKENGFIDKERQSSHQEKKERLHEFEYLDVDDQGNWTQQLMIRYDIADRQKKKVYEETTVRKIEYYD